jgi:hypothetical protein
MDQEKRMTWQETYHETHWLPVRHDDQEIVRYDTWKNSEGQLHREDGPALINYRGDRSVHSELWFLNDRLHRFDGAAETKYDSDGAVRVRSWYIHGKPVTKIELDAHNPSTSEERLGEIYLGDDEELRKIAFAHPNFPKWAKDWIDPS